MAGSAGMGLGIGAGFLAGEAGDRILTNWLLPLALVAPGIVGVAMGAAHSKATSPTKLDEETIQASMESSELEQLLGTMRRRKQQALAQEDVTNESAKRTVPERSIRM